MASVFPAPAQARTWGRGMTDNCFGEPTNREGVMVSGLVASGVSVEFTHPGSGPQAPPSDELQKRGGRCRGRSRDHHAPAGVRNTSGTPAYLTRCRILRDSTLSTRSLSGNYK
jgi:hypothetical protein